jgi:16S rRNA (guanine527-N7)-methyltransferase
VDDLTSPSLPLLPEFTSIWQETLDWQPTSEQVAQFQLLYKLIIEGNRQLNLTRITDPKDFWEKHLWDSLRGIQPLLVKAMEAKGIEGVEKIEGGNTYLSASASPTSPTPFISPTIIDIGTGAGFPGIPCALALPNSTSYLLDSTRKKIVFIEQILGELNLSNVKTITARAEEIGQQRSHRKRYDVALIRAVSSVTVCAEYALPLLKQGGLAVVYRGTWTDEENIALENAMQELGGKIESIDQFKTPLSESDRTCLYLRKIAPTPPMYPRQIGIPTQQPL